MLYETRMLEREQAAGKAGYEQGMQRGINKVEQKVKLTLLKSFLKTK
jgi:hypothetical protein